MQSDQARKRAGSKPRNRFRASLTDVRGFALVIVLAILVLLLGLVMAYFSRAALQRQISSSSAATAKAALLSEAAYSTVMEDLALEIDAGSQAEDPAFANATVHLKRPIWVFDSTSGKNVAPSMVPQRSGDNGIANIVKVSRRNTPFYEDLSGYGTAAGSPAMGPTRASDVATDSPSQNGYRVSKARWNRAKLMTDAEFSNFTVPDWIYLTRSDSTPTLIDSTTLPGLRNHAADNDKFVIGRFAYVVYDVGGLIDVNMVGNGLDSVTNALKGRLHQVSLTEGLGSATLPSFPAFVSWRWPFSATNDSSEVGGLFDPKRNFIDVVKGEQALVNRQDLINYASRPGSALSPDALPYLTTFSRDVNASAYAPDPNAPEIPAAYFATGDTPQSELNPGLLGPSVRFSEDVVLTRPDGPIKVRAGNSVMPRRFPLSKLSLLSQANPDTDELKYYFGLEKQPDGRYLYDTARINGRLASLAKVAAFRDGTTADPEGSGAMLPKAREPNFFEILQGVIAAGSLGKSGSSPAFAAQLAGQNGLSFDQHNKDNTELMAHAVDSLRVRQVLQIGANIIDQWDEDDIPTSILYPSGIPDQFIEMYGVENLPYITQVTTTPYRGNYAFDGVGPRECLDLWALFDVWNPHQNAKAPSGITKFRIVPSAGSGSSTCFLITDSSFPPGVTTNAFFYNGFTGVYPQTNTQYDGGTNATLKLLAGYDAGGNPIPGGNLVSPIKDLNTKFNLELTFPPGSYSELQTVGSGEPTEATDVPGVLLAHHNFSQIPIEISPPVSRPNAAIPRKADRSKNLQKTLNYWYDMNVMYPYQAWASPSGIEIPVRTMNLSLTIPATELKGPAYETEGAGGERIYPAGTVFDFPSNNMNYWSVEPPLTFAAGSTKSQPTATATTIYAKHGTKAHNYFRFAPSSNFPISFDLQAEVNGNWITYQRLEGLFPLGQVFTFTADTKANVLNNTHHSEPGAPLDGFYKWMNYSGSVMYGGASLIKVDPRSVRFGLSEVGYNSSGSFLRQDTGTWNGTWNVNTTALKWVTPTGNYILGKNFKGSTAPAGYNPPTNAEGFENFWSTKPMALYGLISNDPTRLDAAHPMRYSDIDGVVRPADGYWGGLPTIPGRTNDRPMILNRSFRSVGELGYVFRDTPWKTLDFATKYSGDIGLLDVFSLDETTKDSPLVAGKVNLNTRQEPVLEALLRGTFKQTGVPDLTAAQAKTLAAAIVAESTRFPFRHRGEFVTRVLDRSGANDPLGDTRKTEREAAVRALAEVGSTRTWNFLIDLIAQSGQLSSSAASGKDFLVRGAQRYWIQVAVDRLTGEIVSVQKEKVQE